MWTGNNHLRDLHERIRLREISRAQAQEADDLDMMVRLGGIPRDLASAMLETSPSSAGRLARALQRQPPPDEFMPPMWDARLPPVLGRSSPDAWADNAEADSEGVTDRWPEDDPDRLELSKGV